MVKYKTIAFRDERGHVVHEENAHTKEVDAVICRELAKYNSLFGKNPAEISVHANRHIRVSVSRNRKNSYLANKH